MNKRIETATETITVDSNNVVRVERKGCTIPRNFSFAALGKRVEGANVEQAMVAPALFTLFMNDYPVVKGTYAELYAAAWKAHGRIGSLVDSFIIC